MIAAALIVKGDKEEAKLLERCLESIDGYVDAIFITGTYVVDETEYKDVENVAKKYNAVFSKYKWVKDFAAARNFNFSQVPKEYEFIFWCDADDIIEHPENIREVIEENPNTDAIASWYLYDFDEYLNPTVVHKKTQIVRNDGCVSWMGKLHEDFVENRAIKVHFTDAFRRIHRSSTERALVAKQRNVEVALSDVESNPSDPRTHWNLANSYMGNGENDKALVEYNIFLEKSSSDDEKYIAMMRLAEIYDSFDKEDAAKELYWKAIGMFPDMPDAYYRIGEYHFRHRRWKDAERYIKMGLIMKPQYHKFIVYNPRDYDYNPLLLLSKIYIQISRPDLAIPMLEACLEICPKENHLKDMVEELKKEKAYLDKAIEFVKNNGELPDEEFVEQYNKLDEKLKSHPAVSILRNQKLVKRESSGRDIVYYCGQTAFDWNPELMKTKGFGGSEEAVMNLSKQWAKMGYNVTVYNSCGIEPSTHDGVTYKPYWMFNYRDAADYLIVWRHPALLDYDVNAKKVYVDLHDVIKEGEFNEKRLKKIDKIFVKTQAHRILFPNIPDEKFNIVPNGMDFELFDQKVKRDQYLMVNTSSPDRSLDVLPDLFERVKKEVPQARLVWVYGFDNFKIWHEGDQEKLAWMNKTIKRMEEVGIENLGRVTQKETAKLLLQANIFAYPTEFYEIDCISVKKAQACGAIPVVTDFAAMKESVQFGALAHSTKNKDNWSKPYQFTFGLEDKKAQDEWVSGCISYLKNPPSDEYRKEMYSWAERFRWELIAKEWFSENMPVLL